MPLLPPIEIKPPKNHEEHTLPRLLLYFLRAVGGTQDDLRTDIETRLSDVLSDETVKSWMRKTGFSIPGGANRVALLNTITNDGKNQHTEDWRNAFFQCFARKGLPFSEYEKKPLLAENITYQEALNLHKSWILTHYHRPLMGETFSIENIYVPIKLTGFGFERGLAEKDQVFFPEMLEEYAIEGKIQDKEYAWVFIKGSPGSGKSVQALYLASHLAKIKTIGTVFIRLNRTNPEAKIDFSNLPFDINDGFSIDCFMQIIKQSQYSNICLILDGLDEIGTDSQTIQNEIAKTINLIQAKIIEAKSYNKTVQVIAFGRETVTQVAAENLREATSLYTMGNLSGYIGFGRTEENSYGDDLRPQWWQQFLKSRNYRDDWPLPHFLSDPNNSLYELGKEPLLAYLISRTALPVHLKVTDEDNITDLVNTLTTNKNRNAIYHDIINEVRTAEAWHQNNRPVLLPSKQYLDVLRYMALATWQEGSSRTASISRIYDVITSTETRSAFTKLITSYHDDTSENLDAANLVTAFYYRIHQNETENSNSEFEFTHKTFSEYLLATFIFDQFEVLLGLEAPNTPLEQKVKAQIKWLELVQAGPETPEIADFIIDEAEIRFPNRSFSEWCKTFDLIRQITSLNHITQEYDINWVSAPDTLIRVKRGSSLLLLFWAALNRQNFLKKNIKFLFGSLNSLDDYDLKLLQPPLNSGMAGDGVEIAESIPSSFLGYCLSGLKFDGNDLTGFFVNGGNIIGLDILNSSFSHSMWYHIQFSNILCDTSNFLQSRFTQITWQDCIFNGGEFSRSLFIENTLDDAHFDGTRIEQSDFRRCVFQNSTFKDISFNFSDMGNSTFKNCTFSDVSFEHTLLTESEFKNCTFDNNSFSNSDLELDIFQDCKGDFPQK